jgi:predicted CopG family antitoxin
VPETTTIQIRIETWQALNARKLPNDSFDDVIQELLQDDTEHSSTADIATVESQANTEGAESNPEPIQTPDDAPDRINEADARAAIEAAVQFVQENGGATMREIVLAVMPKHPLGYDPDSDRERIGDPDQRNRSTWWRKVVKPALSSHPQIEKPAPHDSEWVCVK